jgi:hypothetical protein
MKQVKFGIRFTVNDYALGELGMFVECATNIEGERDLQDRYIKFLRAVKDKQVKPSTLVDSDVLAVFADDLENRASIDYLEGHYDDEPEIMAGGKMFYGRYLKLKEVHCGLIK